MKRQVPSCWIQTENSTLRDCSPTAPEHQIHPPPLQATRAGASRKLFRAGFEHVFKPSNIFTGKPPASLTLQMLCWSAIGQQPPVRWLPVSDSLDYWGLTWPVRSVWFFPDDLRYHSAGVPQAPLSPKNPGLPISKGYCFASPLGLLKSH